MRHQHAAAGTECGENPGPTADAHRCFRRPTEGLISRPAIGEQSSKTKPWRKDVTGFGRKVLHGIAALLLAGVLAGCEDMRPYRTE